jgi:hypothetical protein
MEMIRARHQGQKHIYVHNDLSNAAHHFLEQIQEKLKGGNCKGIAFEYMACLVMLAFTFEAKINFLGHKLIKGWNERQSFNSKVTEVLGHLRVTPDWKVRPFSSIETLKNFRDSIAHGKPVETTFDEEVIKPADDIDRRIDLDSEWLAYCSHDNVFNTYDDVDAIWGQLLNASGLKVYDTITRGDSGLTFIERIVEKET